jgi:hypothetical protein
VLASGGASPAEHASRHAGNVADDNAPCIAAGAGTVVAALSESCLAPAQLDPRTLMLPATLAAAAGAQIGSVSPVTWMLIQVTAAFCLTLVGLAWLAKRKK